MLVTKLTKEDFIKENARENERFSIAGAGALYDYIDELYSSTDENGLSLVNTYDICLEWFEYTTKDEAVSDLDYSNWDELDEQRGTYEFDGGVLVCDY